MMISLILFLSALWAAGFAAARLAYGNTPCGKPRTMLIISTICIILYTSPRLNKQYRRTWRLINLNTAAAKNHESGAEQIEAQHEKMVLRGVAVHFLFCRLRQG
jgi:hypothetical protein